MTICTGTTKPVERHRSQTLSCDSDPFNRIKKIKQVMPDGASYTTQYQYDISGQMTGIRYPNSADWLNYQYDQMGRLVGIPGFAELNPILVLLMMKTALYPVLQRITELIQLISVTRTAG